MQRNLLVTKMEDEIKFKDVSEFFKRNKKVLIYILLFLVILFSVYIRTQNLDKLINVATGKPTLAPDLDPFLFLRRARTIIQEGGLPEVDNMRYVAAMVPHNFNLNSYAIAFLYRIFSFFGNVDIATAGIWLPVIATALSLIPLFFLVRLIFSFGKEKKMSANIIAVLSCLILIITPAYLHRTMGGVPELEALGMLLFFSAFYFLLLAWRKTSENSRAYLIYSFIGGIFTGLMWVTWGGYKFIFMTLGLSVLIAYVFGKTDRKKIWWYSIAIFVPMIFYTITRGGFFNLTEFTYLLPLFTGGVLILDLISERFDLNEKIEKTKLKKIPYKFIVIIAVIIIGILFLSVFKSPGFVVAKFREAGESLLHPFGLGRVGLTVAENKQPYFYPDWTDSFGPSFKNIPILFWLFFLGSISLFHKMTKKFKQKNRWIINIAYIYAISALVFSRFSNSSLFNGISWIAVVFYYSGFLVLLAGFLYIYIKDRDEFKKINFAYIFLFTWFFWTILGSRGAIRLLFLMCPVVAILASFFVVEIVIKAKRAKGEISRPSMIVIAVFVVLFFSLIIIPTPGFLNKTGLRSFSQTILEHAESSIPQNNEFQWQKAMAWVSENTPEDAVFGHWWDYGYWVQYDGERATDTDGGHQIGWWDHLNARYVLTAENERTALQYLKAHNVTHFLIDSTDIGKYGAYSSIGGDESGDRYSFIPRIDLDKSQIIEEQNGTTFVYPAGIPFDEDVIYNDSEGNSVFFPAGGSNSYILGFTLRESNGEFRALTAIIMHNGKKVYLSMRYLYTDHLIDLGEGFDGALYLIPKLEENGGQVTINHAGSALFLSRRIMASQFARLYLFNESENFELVHSQSDYILEQIRAQGLNIGDFAYYYGLRGPIKIWKINYPDDIPYFEEYIKTDGERYGELDYLGV